MIVRVYNKKNKTNEHGKNSLSDLSLSVFGTYEEYFFSRIIIWSKYVC